MLLLELARSWIKRLEAFGQIKAIGSGNSRLSNATNNVLSIVFFVGQVLQSQYLQIAVEPSRCSPVAGFGKSR